ncbi:Macro domain-containing protein [Spironucleus salmonicida]|uniref:Macro domain-containing protein n=1 Tax=Spironucleus salmonicida TaxID=348837 RepID=V6LXV0_9EUKA|nr:Macro domain-containing protein [Spironucleus salmonicida]|eukprot:EST49467.1 Macro domain-containing protein [Spironucleus salmonicida]
MNSINQTLPQILAATEYKYQYKHVSIIVSSFPILNLAIDSIFNPTRDTLIGSFEIDGFQQKAGYHLMQKVERIGKQSLGTVVKTMAYDLPYKFIIHGVFPDCRYKLPNPQAYKQCIKQALSLADFYKMKSISFPECGIKALEWPETEAVNLLTNCFFQWIKANPDSTLSCIILCTKNKHFQSIFVNKIQALKIAYEGIEYYQMLDEQSEVQ